MLTPRTGLRVVDLDGIAAGPGLPFPEGRRTPPIRRCVPCGIETTEDTCFGCGRATESFTARAFLDAFFSDVN